MMRNKKTPLVLLILTLIAGAVVFLHPSIHGTDGVCNYVYARSFLFDCDWNFTNDYAEFQELKEYAYPFSGGVFNQNTNRPDNSYGVGASFLWMPFVATTKVYLNLVGKQDLNTGYSPPFEWAVGIGTVFWASLGLILIYLLLCNLEIGEWAAIVGVLCVWLVTPLFFYMYLHPSMSHGVSFFAASWAFYLLGRMIKHGVLNTNGVTFAAFGLSLGLIILCRMQDIPLAAVIFAGFAYVAFNEVRKFADNKISSLFMPAMTCALAGYLAFLPQLTAWNALYGSMLAGPRNYMSQERYLAPIYFFHALFHPFHGLFYWHPILFICLLGLIVKIQGILIKDTYLDSKAKKRIITFQALGILSLIAQTILIGSWWSWYGGASFGHRMYISTFAMFALGFSLILTKIRIDVKNANIRGLLYVIFFVMISLGVYWNVGLCWLYGSNIIPHEESVYWADMIKGLFFDLPRVIFGKI